MKDAHDGGGYRGPRQDEGRPPLRLGVSSSSRCWPQAQSSTLTRFQVKPTRSAQRVSHKAPSPRAPLVHQVLDLKDSAFLSSRDSRQNGMALHGGVEKDDERDPTGEAARGGGGRVAEGAATSAPETPRRAQELCARLLRDDLLGQDDILRLFANEHNSEEKSVRRDRADQNLLKDCDTDIFDKVCNAVMETTGYSSVHATQRLFVGVMQAANKNKRNMLLQMQTGNSPHLERSIDSACERPCEVLGASSRSLACGA